MIKRLTLQRTLFLIRLSCLCTVYLSLAIFFFYYSKKKIFFLFYLEKVSVCVAHYFQGAPSSIRGSSINPLKKKHTRKETQKKTTTTLTSRSINRPTARFRNPHDNSAGGGGAGMVREASPFTRDSRR